MAEGDCTVMNNLKEQLLLKVIDFVNDTFKVALYSVALASPDGNPVYTAVNEIAPAGYVAGGETLTGKAVTQDDVNNRAAFDGNNITWLAMDTATIRAARLYDDTTVSKWIVCEWEIATDSMGWDYTLTFHISGILLLS